jgi:hypothetical protein
LAGEPVLRSRGFSSQLLIVLAAAVAAREREFPLLTMPSQIRGKSGWSEIRASSDEFGKRQAERNRFG